MGSPASNVTCARANRPAVRGAAGSGSRPRRPTGPAFASTAVIELDEGAPEIFAGFSGAWRRAIDVLIFSCFCFEGALVLRSRCARSNSRGARCEIETCQPFSGAPWGSLEGPPGRYRLRRSSPGCSVRQVKLSTTPLDSEKCVPSRDEPGEPFGLHDRPRGPWNGAPRWFAQFSMQFRCLFSSRQPRDLFFRSCFPAFASGIHGAPLRGTDIPGRAYGCGLTAVCGAAVAGGGS